MGGGQSGGDPLGGLQRGQRLITEINVTPLVDIMLVLLIIFMVTASYIVRDSLEVKLPEASTGVQQKVSPLALTITADGAVSLNGKPTDLDGIRRFIGDRRSKGIKMEAIIAADKRVMHGRVVQLIDLVRAAGVSKFAINVLKPRP